jgi:hypothetical protein
MRKLVVILAVAALALCLIATASAYAQIGGMAKSVGKGVAKEKAKEKATKAAKQAKPAKAAKPGKFSGTISSVSDSSLVVAKAGGATETFVLNAQTKKEGNLQTGGKATVQYKVDGSTKLATSVKASPPKAAKAAKAPKAAKPKEAKAKKK